MKRFVHEWGIFILIISLIVVSRLFFWSLVEVSGHSMDPTLADRERLVVLRHTAIHRFDIVVAKEPDKDIVKRVIGLPGDTISYKNDLLIINGKKYSEPYLRNFQNELSEHTLANTYAKYPLTKSLSVTDRKNFELLARKTEKFTEKNNQTSFTVKVPVGEYFLLGDNRVISLDSRSVGNFNRNEILGVAKVRIWPITQLKIFGKI